MKSHERIIELDGLRGVAVTMVLAWHFIGQTLLSSNLAHAHYVSSIFIFGRTGVDLFFVLSGFLIIGILIDQKQSPNLLQVFYVRRACRILPPYLLLLAVFLIAKSEFNLRDQASQTVPFWSFFLFLQNWFMSFSNDWGPSAISVTWSVAIEEQFYLMFPIVLLFTPTKRLRAVLLSIAVLSAIGRAALSLAGSTTNMAQYVNTFFRLDALCIGGVVATFYRDKELLRNLAARRADLLKGVMALSIFIAPLIYGINTNIRLTMYVFGGHFYLAVLFGAVLLVTILYKDRAGTFVVVVVGEPRSAASDGIDSVGFPEIPSPFVTVIWLAVPVMVRAEPVPLPVLAQIPFVEFAASAARSASYA